MEQFGKWCKSKDGYRNVCKTCWNAAVAVCRSKNPELYRRKEYHRNRWYNLGITRDRHLQKTFGITLDDFNRMLENQGGVCAICKSPPGSKRTKHLHVDHNHATGEVRGLLCGYCNPGLGNFKDDPGLMVNAIDYLKKTETNFEPLTFVA